MKSARWQRLDALVEAALDLPEEERSPYLAAACADDPSLCREAESLLAVDDEAEGFLEAPAAVAPSPPPTATAGAAAAGERIGPYRIERELGSGGMGVVYLAARADDAYRARVAIKLLHGGPRAAHLVRRFHGERQILASLDHPSIARLVDGGTTEDGRPYLVMEYIEGLPIDEYCDTRRLTVRQRVALFRRVCAAVHYAHQNLVVHRDIKPSNILVTADGTPRLLDFGIAKLLDPERLAMTVEATTAGLRPMTPHYASPEQVRGETITTASDVYSLGVLLYQLLTGRLPHRLDGLSPRRLDRVLTETEPTRPSVAVAGDGGSGLPGSGLPGAATAGGAETAAETVSRRRAVRLPQLRRQLSGDLDHIVLMALRRDPERRYGSVEQLSEDLSRHLEGLPVRARQGALGYRVGVFLRRHRWAVAVAASVLALVVAFAAAMAQQAAQTARQRDRAEQERVRAEQERQRAEQVSGFLVDLFKEVDPWTAGGDDVTARQVLEKGAEKIERELVDQPKVRSSLQDAIGAVYLHLGLYAEAAPLLETALETREAHLPPGDPEIAASLRRLANLYRRQGKYGEAEALLRRALAIQEGALGPDHVDVAQTVRDLSIVHRSQGRYADAEELGHHALSIYRRALGSDHPEVAMTLGILAGAAARQGRTEEAERLLEQELAIDEKAYGEVHPTTAAALSNLGHLRLARGALADAEAYLDRALAASTASLGEDHPHVGNVLLALGQVARERDRPAVAEQRYRRALGIYERTVGGEHAWFASCLFMLGNLLTGEGRLTEARPLLQRALAVRERTLGPEHPWTGESLRGLAELYRAEGRLAEAAGLCDRAAAIWEQNRDFPDLAEIPEVCAAVFRAAGRTRAAEELERRVPASDSGPD